jgi:hypothetical protein
MPKSKRTTPVTPWDPSKRATARVKNPIPVPTDCPHCEGTDIEICKNSRVYRGQTYGEWPWVVMCNTCSAYVGLHPFTCIPLGTLADRQTRDARKRVKHEFIAWQETNNLSRNDAYRLLAQMMRIPCEQCHFGWFDVDQCDLAMHAVRKLVKQKRYRPDSPFAKLRELLS